MTAADELAAAAQTVRAWVSTEPPTRWAPSAITAFGPGLADWLDATVAEMSVAEGTEYLLPGDSTDFGSWNAALALARQINGQP